MKIIHITHGKVNPMGSNGISNVVYHLNNYEILQGVESEIWSIVDKTKKPYKLQRSENVFVNCFPRHLNGKFGILSRVLEDKDNISLVHFHLPWYYIKIPIAKLLKKLSIPYVISGHSSYSSNQIMNYKKKLALILYEKKYLHNAAAIRAITKEESTEIKKKGINIPTFTVSNGMDDPIKKYSNGKRVLPDNKINFIFVGELRDQKNIDGLIKAISLIDLELRKDLLFTIIGPDSRNNLERLRNLANTLDVSGNFSFVGAKYGDDKSQYYYDCDIYIQPSHSEVVSLAAIEAMAYSKPCVITRTCDVSYYLCSGAFIMCEPHEQEISDAIIQILQDKNKWSKMGYNARKLYESNFTWNKNVALMIKYYEKFAK